MTDNDRVFGHPSKAFFVDMITRDLTVEASILDLIDNALDEAVARQGVDVTAVLTAPGNGDRPGFADAKVTIAIDEDSFIIKDTCGGISVEKARETVFRFGNPGAREHIGGLGVYGIGMKRSFFKLGRQIAVRSATDTERFVVDIDVAQWTEKGDDDWDFSFTTVEQLPRTTERPTPGTEIRITNLTEAARRRFRSPGFINDLLRRVECTYALFIKAGLQLHINSRQAVSKLPANVTSDQRITPARRNLKVDHVEVLILVGVSPRDDQTPHGWYVFCNGRIVLYADKTTVTGWGNGLPKWHTKFGHFVGYACFRSDDVRRLPWPTTKQGVVTDTNVYQKALSEMRVQARPALNFLSRLYPGEIEEEGVRERHLMSKAKAVPVTQLPLKESSFQVTLRDPDVDPDAREINIQYKKTRGEIKQIQQCVRTLRNASARGIGEYAFDYLKKQECAE